MKTINCLLGFLTALLISCRTQKNYTRNSFSYDSSQKQIWIDSYKYEAFYACIKEGLQNDSLRVLLQRKDLFNRNLEMSFETIDNARSHGMRIARDIPLPQIKIDDGETELKQKKFLSYTCLAYYASRELDSIANSEYDVQTGKSR